MITTAAVFLAFALGAFSNSQYKDSNTESGPEVSRATTVKVPPIPADTPRALIVLPGDGYATDEIEAWEKAVMNLEIAWGFASDGADVVKSIDGRGLRERVAPLKGLSADKFDVLIVSGGDKLHGFLKKQHGELTRIIAEARANRKFVLTGSPDAFHEVNHHWNLYDETKDECIADEIHLNAESNYIWTKHPERLQGALKLATDRATPHMTEAK